MPDVDLPFSRQEYADRLTKVRASMEARGIEVLVAADPSNMSWLTGYDGWSFYTPQAVVVTHDGEPWWWGRRMDANGARRTVYMDEAQILDYSDDHVMSTERHAFGQLAGLLDGMATDQPALASSWITTTTRLPPTITCAPAYPTPRCWTPQHL